MGLKRRRGSVTEEPRGREYETISSHTDMCSNTSVETLLWEAAISMNRTQDDVQPYVSLLRDQWYQTVGDLRRNTGWHRFSIPVHLLETIKEQIAVAAPSRPVSARTDQSFKSAQSEAEYKFQDTGAFLPISPSCSDVLCKRNSLRFVILPKELVAASGTGRTDDHETVVFIRESSRHQIAFILQKVLGERKVGMIYGQPGTGKSLITFYVGSCISSHWTVTWIHLLHGTDCFPTKCLCVRLNNGTKFTLKLNLTRLVEHFESIVDCHRERQLLVIDGFIERARSPDLIPKCEEWLNANVQNRRLLFVASMASGESGQQRYDLMEGIEVHRQLSWKYEEYKSALSNVSLYESVQDSLDASPSAASIEEKLEAKYFYAGGSARYMLQWKTSEVMLEINRLIRSQHDIQGSTSSNTGNLSPTVTNRLFNVYGNDSRVILSKYAASRIGFILGPGRIIDMAREFCIQNNPIANGIYLEEFFFACAATGTITFTTINSKRSLGKVTWEYQKTVGVFNPDHPTGQACPTNKWLRPMKWNNPAYDGVFLDISNRARTIWFVQVTRANRHDIKLDYCKALVKRLRDLEIFFATKVEIVFVVPTSKLLNYKRGRIVYGVLPAPNDWPLPAPSMRNWGINFDLNYTL